MRRGGNYAVQKIPRVSEKANELPFAFKREGDWSPAARAPHPPWGNSVHFSLCGSPVVFLSSERPIGPLLARLVTQVPHSAAFRTGPSFQQRSAGFHVMLPPQL